MGRHTGNFLLGTVFLSAAFLFAMSHSTTESAIREHRDGFQLRTLTAGRATAHDSVMAPGHYSDVQPQQFTVIRQIPSGSRIVIGSLDVSGARHRVRVKVANAIVDENGEQSDWLPVYRCSASEVQQHRLQRHYLSQKQNESRFRENCSDTTLQSRIFLTPHFCDAGVVHEPVECRNLGESQRVRVYADRRSVRDLDAKFFCAAMLQRLSTAVETRALPIVEEWIGEVADIDRDHKLSIVVTDLDRHSVPSAEHTPIHGCIRETDFRGNSDFCGDIVYVDPGILALPASEQAALLTHELTHAAICSMSHSKMAESDGHTASGFRNPELQQVPAWLNEAISHFAELKCCEESQNFQRRIDHFLADSSQSPIVAVESVLSLQARRAGSRCAATWFLSQYFSSPQAVRQFLDSSEISLDRRIAGISAQPFDLAFRQWTLSMATTDSDRPALRTMRLHVTDPPSQFSLLGTAFVCIECPAAATTVTIEADTTAQLQVSVLECQ